jgi:hypothetical protein
MFSGIPGGSGGAFKNVPSLTLVCDGDPDNKDENIQDGDNKGKNKKKRQEVHPPRGLTAEDCDQLIDIIERILPTEPAQWDRVVLE